jgi:hypothetical protein
MIYLEKEFKATFISTLSDFTHKIALISKVRDSRSAQKLGFTDYDEVTPSKTDAHGVVIASSKGEELGGANERLIKAQRLNEGDLLVSYRGKYGYAVARVGSEYKRTVVGNNSTIRIQFRDNLNKEIPVLIQAYLEQDSIQGYLRRCSIKANPTRPIINSKILLDLPIPNVLVNSNAMNFSEFHNRRLELLNSAKVLRSKCSKIISILGNAADQDLNTFTNNPHLIEKLSAKDALIQEFLEDIHKRIDEFGKLYKK